MIVVPATTVMLLRFGRLALGGLVPLLLVAPIGGYITYQVAGGAALKAWCLGCAVGLLGNWIGTIPAVMADNLAGRDGSLAILLGTALRFLAALVMTPILALSGWVQPLPFVVGVVAGYLAILLGETVALVTLVRAERGAQP